MVLPFFPELYAYPEFCWRSVPSQNTSASEWHLCSNSLLNALFSLSITCTPTHTHTVVQLCKTVWLGMVICNLINNSSSKNSVVVYNYLPLFSFHCIPDIQRAIEGHKASLKKRFERTGKEVQHCRLQKKVFLILFIRSSTISAVYSAGATSYGGQLWPLLC